MTINFEAACKDLFKTEKKWMTLLLLSVCFLIPVVGPMVILGYLFRRYAGERAGIPAADFDFAHFGEHLQTGLWPVLSGMVAALVCVPFVMLAMVPMFVIPVLDPQNEVLILIGFALGMGLYMAALLAMNLLIMPIQLRSGLMMDFMAGFSGRFLIDFIKKVGLSYFLWYALLMMASVLLMFVGYLAFIVGVYVVVTWVAVTSFHLLFQHYDLYLERGGTPIPVNPALLKVLSKPLPPAIPPQGPPTTMPG